MRPWLLPTHVLNMEFLSQPDLMLCYFVYNTVRADGRENYDFDYFSSGGRVS